jgi:antitoxin VapB
MALSIKSDEADRLARELAAATHESMTQAITTALRERLDRVNVTNNSGSIAARLHRLAVEVSGMPTLDSRSADDIIGYDEHGLPT